MSHDPMAAALARLHAEHPDLPTDGGRVWEPVQDDAEQAVGPHQFVRFLTGPDATPRDICHCGRDLFDPVHPDWPPLGPADACQFHSPTGDPCECGCDAGADCHPKES